MFDKIESNKKLSRIVAELFIEEENLTSHYFYI